MDALFAVALVTPLCLLLLMPLIPAGLSSRTPARLGQLTAILTGMMLFGSVAASIRVISEGPIGLTFFRFTDPVPVCVGIHVDTLTVVMLLLVSFIGLIIARYAQSYLQGDPHQARFFRWMSFTLGATLLLVVSCNLVLFTAAWMLTSLGLHQLLTYYPERSWAMWAARKKFLISRLGDLLLLAAIGLTYGCFGTTEFGEIFAAARAIHAGQTAGTVWTSLIGFLLVLGAMTKSAQFPFHSWLPDTMETPTPVSALMHAGVINAGGFLVIRLSPVVSLSPLAMDLLALVGGLTALLGSVIMLTQTSIKRSPAYSTIAQMGFMMLQCGLGAFSAALLHIVAHSAYKAHAFLSCGSVLDRAAKTAGVAFPEVSATGRGFALAGSAGVAGMILLGVGLALGIDLLHKPGGPVLGLVLLLALTQLQWSAFLTGRGRIVIRGVAAGVLVTASYLVSYLGIDYLLQASSSQHTLASSSLDNAVLALVAIGFVFVFMLQSLAEPLSKRRWVRALYVHAMNGFYIDIPARRLTARVYRQAAPVQ